MADINKSRGLDEGKANDFGKVTAGPSECFVVKADDVSSKNAGDITLKVGLDVSEALTGLKAVERQAKSATKALRELETQSQNVGFEDDSVISAIQRSYEVVPDVIDISTKEAEVTYYDLTDVPIAELSRELARREGVYRREAIGPFRWDLHSGKKATLIVIEDSE